MDVITTHTNADFDCLGAMTAALRLYPGALLCFSGSQEKGVRDFIKHHPELIPRFMRVKEINLQKIDRLVIVDCQHPSRIGPFASILGRNNLEIHIFDHHLATDESIAATGGEIRASGSTSTIFAAELIKRGVTLDPAEATLMLLGIHEDTGRLLFASSTAEDYRVAAWLVSQGAVLSLVSEALTPELTKDQMELLRQLLTTVKSSTVNGMTVTFAHATSEHYVADIASLAHLMRDMESGDALFLVVAMAERVYLVARSNNEAIDAAELMKHFHGGGHRSAAAAVVHDTSCKEVLQRLEGLLRRSLQPAVAAGSIMSAPVKVMPDSTTIAEARELLTRYNCSAMPVLSGASVAGIISRKTVEKALYHDLGSSPVTDFMQTDFFSANPQTAIAEIQSYMLTKNRRFVPVFESGVLVGAVTRTDLMRHNFGGGRDAAPLYDLESLEPPPRTRSVAGTLENRLSADQSELLQQLGAVGDSLNLPVYVVGGFVRDLLLGIANLDLDITVEGDGILFAEHFASLYGGRVRSHRKFGTAVLLLQDGRKLDVASTRLEYYESPGALPTVERASLRHDLYRRDFTINTLAICINSGRYGELTDHFGGQQDLHERTVRVLHNLSFVEDPTRVFRAVRFEQRLGFNIAPQTERLIRSALRMHALDRLGGERLFNELVLIMRERQPLAALRRIASLGLLQLIHPALRMSPTTQKVLEEAEKMLIWYRLLYLDEQCEEWQLYLLSLCDTLKPDEFLEVNRRLAIPARISARLCSQRKKALLLLSTVRRRLKSAPPPCNSEVYQWFNGLMPEMLLYLAARAGNEKMRRLVSIYLNRLKGVAPELDGDYLKSIGLTPGPLFRRIKERLLKAKLDGKAKGRGDEIALVAQLIAVEGNGKV